jgi:hypothetical protein
MIDMEFLEFKASKDEPIRFAEHKKNAEKESKEKTIDELKEQFIDDMKRYLDLIPSDLIRIQHQSIDVDALIVSSKYDSIHKYAYEIKSCYAYVSNQATGLYFKRYIEEIQFTKARGTHKATKIKIVKFKQDDLKSEKNVNHEVQYKNKTLNINLKDILSQCWRSISYTKAVVKPYSPKDISIIDEKDKTFNLFGTYQHIYNSKFEIDQELVDLWLNHIKDILCAGDEKCYEYLISWFAHILQRPDEKTKICPLIKSRPGAGKNFIFTIFTKYVLSLDMALIVNDMDRLTSKFNMACVGKTLIIADEALDSGNRKGNQVMKNRITEDRQMVEPKGRDAFEVDDFTNYVILTNNDFQSIIENGDRRYFCLEASDKYCPGMPESKEYWNMMHDKLPNLTAGKHIFHYLLSRDISNFNIHNLPNTDYKKELNAKQANVAIRFLKYYYETRVSIAEDKNDSVYKNISIGTLYNLFLDWAEDGRESKIPSKHLFNIMLTNAGLKTRSGKEKQDDGSLKSAKCKDLTEESLQLNHII